MATDYGTDISDFPDLEPMMPEYSGRVILLEGLYRRFITARGSLFYDANFGYRVQDLVGDSFGPGDLALIQTEIARECLKDERVEGAQARCRFDARTGQLIVAVTLQDAQGPFSLVLSVDKVTTKVLKAG